jgi:glycosyltransferase involved in cell wall biosynthesis
VVEVTADNQLQPACYNALFGCIMRVLSVAFPEMAIGPSGGGAEQILSVLDAALVKQGHESFVIAAPGSRVAGHLVESTDHACVIRRVLAQEPFDLVHFHGLDFWRYLPSADLPMIATLHLPIPYYPEQALQDCQARGIVLTCVSSTQSSSSPVSRDFLVIPNGIPLDCDRPCRPGRRLLWLGRICPEKAPHIALEIAHRLGASLTVAGPLHRYPEHRAYFAQRVEPLLDDERRYVGSADEVFKRSLLSGARCLLITSAVAETSSLVAMESLSAGTPVVTFRTGALPEIVDDGETGFVVDSADEMCEKISTVDDLSRQVCRQRAVARFDSQGMVDNYLTLYRRTITRQRSIC